MPKSRLDKGAPSLRRWLQVVYNVLVGLGLTEVDADFQLTADAW
jgi:hypothetical protein